MSGSPVEPLGGARLDLALWGPEETMTTLLLSLAFFAQMPAPPSPDLVSSVAGDQLTISAPRTGVTLRLTSSSLTGPNLQLGRSGRQLRGRFRNQPIEVRWTDDRVSGQVGPGAPLNLQVQKTDQGLRVEGMFGGIRSHFTLGFGIFEGRVGRCDYHMVASGGPYEGERTCERGVPERVTLSIPASLAQASPGELVAVLSAALLGQSGIF
jgi:hypothetical protein